MTTSEDRSSDDPCRYDEAVLRLLDRPLSDEDLREATEWVAQPLAPPSRDFRSLLCMQLAGEELALPSTSIARVSRATSVRRVPHRSNAIFRGMCNIEGELLLCGNLAALLGLETDESSSEPGAVDSRRMVILGDEFGRWTMEVDGVRGVAYVELADCMPPPVTVQSARDRYTHSLAPLDDDRLAALLDAARLASGFEAALT